MMEHAHMILSPQKILDFWLGPLPDASFFPTEKVKTWWKTDEKLDQEIRNEFAQDIQSAMEGKLDHWLDESRSCLALIILLDQFSRNMYRGTPQAFAQDEKARSACRFALEKGYDNKIYDVEKWLLYMPLMHSEDREDQKKSLECFKHLVENCLPALQMAVAGSYDYAVRHTKIVEKFGRYPHRNKILGRTSTPDEIEFLKQPHSSF